MSVRAEQGERSHLTDAFLTPRSRQVCLGCNAVKDYFLIEEAFALLEALAPAEHTWMATGRDTNYPP